MTSPNFRHLKAVFIIVLLSFADVLSAQRPMEVIINFLPPYPREFAAYYNNPQDYSITVINYTDVEQEVYFLGELHGTYNGVSIRTLPGFSIDVPITLPANGVLNLTGEEIASFYGGLTIQDLEILGVPPEQLNLNGVLPEGEYVWCINAYDFNTPAQPLSIGCSQPFSIHYGDQLNLISPYDGENVLTETFNILWNPTMSDPVKRGQLEYEVKMIDLTEYPDADLDLLFLDGAAQHQLEIVVNEENYIYNGDGSDLEMEDGHEYGLRIRAVDPFNEVAFANNGYSEIRRFGYKMPDPEDEEEDQNGVTECFENCHYTTNISTNNASNPGNFTKWKIGFFEMEDIDIESQNGGTLQGSAAIKVPWLNDIKIAVTFNNLKVNSSGRVYQGSAKARDDSGAAYDLGDVYNTLFVGKSECPSTTLATLADEISTARSVFNMAAGVPAGMPLGFNQNLEGRQFVLGVLDMKFEADRASIALINIMDMSSLAEDFWLSIAGNDVCLTPGGIGGEYILYQAFENRKVGFGNMDVKTLGGIGDDQTIRDQYCYIEMNCEGMKSMAIRGEVSFDRSVIVPDDNGATGGGKVKGRFEMTLDKRNDPATSLYAYNDNDAMTGTHLMFGFEMDDFQVTGLEGWTFEPGSGSMDMSDLENPTEIEFPEQYDVEAIYGNDANLLTLWRGMYLKDIEIKSPKAFQNGTRRGAFVHNFIFDPSLTMDVGVTGLLEIGDGNIEGWGFSIDTFKLEIVQNTFVSGGMYGGINPPITGDIDYINYRAVLDRSEDNEFSFHAIALPDTLISVPISLAKAALCPNSYVEFTTGNGLTQISTFLKGQMVIDVLENIPADLEIPDVIPGFQVRLADFQLNYNSTQGFVTESMVSDGTGSAFAFGIDLQDATCGDLYSGPIIDFEGFEGYEYDVDDLPRLLREGLPGDASPQENVDQFPISINDIALGFSGNQISIDFDIDLTLSTGMADFMIGTRINLLSNLHTNAEGVDRFKISGIRLECGRLGGSDPGSNIGFDPFVVAGELCFIQNEDGSKGFTSVISLGLGVFDMQLNAGFGNHGRPENGAYGSEGYYGWWYFDGMARIPGGLPLVPPFTIAHFNGFGGGIYWNTTAPSVSISMEDIMSTEGTTTLPLPNNNKPRPRYGNRTLAFRTSWNILLDQIMMIDPFVSGTWNTEYGLQSLAFGGDFWSLALSYAERNGARIYGSSITQLSFMDQGDAPDKVALVGTNTIKANIIPGILYGAGLDKTLINASFAIGDEAFFPGETSNSDNDDIFWFFNAGNPYIDDFGGVVFDLPGFNLSQKKKSESNLGLDASFSAKMYTMIGQNIPNFLPDPPGEVARLFGSVASDEGSFDGGGKEDERDATTATTGAGFAMGFHVAASCEIRAVFYAGLSIFSGMDIMLVNMDGASCYTSDGEVTDPGVNGWYGTGRAYAGLEGSIGVKGKILGKEIDIKIIQLIAAMMLTAGGPNPMWLDGRAVLQYNLLAGTIKGSTRMMISVGDKCVPPITSPFDFPIIAEYYPNEEENTDIDPFVSPSVSFTVPINESLYIPDVDGEVHQIRPKLVENDFSLIVDCNNCASAERDERYELIAEDGRSASYNPVNPIAGINGDDRHKQYRMKIKVTAEEYKNGAWKNVKIDGKNWEEKFDFTFRTSPLPLQIPASEVGKTKPAEDQKFYLQDEHAGNHYVHTRSNMEGSYYYETGYDGKNYEYFAIFKDSNGEELHRKNLRYSADGKKLNWDKPSLDNNNRYIVQLIRKQVFQGIPGIASMERKLLISQVLLDSMDMDFNYEVEPELPELSTLTAVEEGETLLYAFEFETSRYNTLLEKMEDVVFDYEEKNGFQRLNFSNFEGFDIIDIDGDLDNDALYSSPPRVTISDPFTSSFHTSMSKPLLGDFAIAFREEYQGEWTGVESESVDLTGGGEVDLGGGGIIIHDMQGAEGGNNQNNNQENNNNNQGSNEHIPVNFPYLPYTNYAWYRIDEVVQSLNENAIRATILEKNDEDDLFIRPSMGSGSGTIMSAPTYNYYNDFSIKYYVLEDVLHDAEVYSDFGEEWVDITRTGDFSTGNGLNYDQTFSASEVNALIRNLESVTNAIQSSRLITGPNSNGFSNTVRFRANKSYESGEEERGTTKNVNFDVH